MFGQKIGKTEVTTLFGDKFLVYKQKSGDWSFFLLPGTLKIEIFEWLTSDRGNGIYLLQLYTMIQSVTRYGRIKKEMANFNKTNNQQPMCLYNPALDSRGGMTN